MATAPERPNPDADTLPASLNQRENAPTQDAEVLLFRRYRVVRELGRGGMGVVLLAHDTALGIDVAVKLLPEMVVRDTEAIADLRKEVLRGMALAHPGIVRTHNFERDEGGAGIIMEYVEGDTLTDLKVRQPGGCFEPDEIRGWIEQLCGILDYAHHEAHIVHRDLKPRNLMLTQAGKIKVADFGIAALLIDSVTRHSVEGKVSGTLSYMSPQQAQGFKPSPLDDIHAVGATMYELLTGKPPFFRGGPASIHSQIISVAPPRMAERREEFEVAGKSSIPPQWEHIVAACLAKDPALRPQSAAELLTLVKAPPPPPPAALAPAPAPTYSPTPVIRPEPSRNRTSSKPILLGAVLILILMAAGAGWFLKDGLHRSGRKSGTAGSSGLSPGQLLAEARVLRENEAYQLARERLLAALAIDPANQEVIGELSALGTLLASSPAPGGAAPVLDPGKPAPEVAPSSEAPPASIAPPASVALIQRVTGSSTLGAQVDDGGRTNTYAARNAIDGKVATAWVAARGAQDVWLRLEFEKEVTITRFTLFPGYGKDAEAFAKNNRVKAFALDFGGGRITQFRCEDRRESQSFLLPDSVTSAVLTVRVLEVYRGEKFIGDTAISEIRF